MNHKDYIICRCEEVMLSDIQQAKKTGATTSQEIKMATRLGMGVCQGRICRSLVDEMVEDTREGLCDMPSKLTVHHPVRPVSLGMVMLREE